MDRQQEIHLQHVLIHHHIMDSKKFKPNSLDTIALQIPAVRTTNS